MSLRPICTIYDKQNSILFISQYMFFIDFSVMFNKGDNFRILELKNCSHYVTLKKMLFVILHQLCSIKIDRNYCLVTQLPTYSTTYVRIRLKNIFNQNNLEIFDLKIRFRYVLSGQ